MSIAFNVDLGAISQVGLDIDNVVTITRLASSTLRWLKSRAPTLCLEQTIGSVGVSLPPVSAFSKSRYLDERRRHDSIYGVVKVKGGFLQSIRLPKNSMPVEGDPGLLCLRALTMGLLCFFSKSQTCSVLSEILPKRLFQYEQEDKQKARLDGPLYDALIRHVQKVSDEEMGDDLRSQLLDMVDNQVHRVSNATREEILACHGTELIHIMGFLDWLLAPAAFRKPTSTYPTRSLKVWSLALVLSKLGFNVQPSRTAVTQVCSERKETELDMDQYEFVPEVVLVIASGWPTDPGACHFTETETKSEKETKVLPRILPIRACPSVAYAEYVTKTSVEARQPFADAKDLEAAFIGTYIDVHKTLGQVPAIANAAGLDLQCPLATLDEKSSTTDKLMARYIQRYNQLDKDTRQHIRGKPQGPSPDDYLEFIINFIMPTMKKYLLPWSSETELEAFHLNDRAAFMFRSLCFSTVMGAISLFTRCNTKTPTNANLDMEFIYTGYHPDYLRSLIRLLVSMDDNHWGVNKSPISSWGLFVNQMMMGVRPNCTTFGTQNNGLTVVMEFVLQPSSKLSSMLTFHSRRGQLLDIPTKQGSITERQCRIQSLNFSELHALESKAEMISTLLNTWPGSSDPIRIDVEPCWDDDPEQCCLCIRLGGLCRFEMSMTRLFDGCDRELVRYLKCNEQAGKHHHWCPGPNIISDLLFEDLKGKKWYFLPIGEMIQQGQTAVADPDYTSRDPRNMHVNWIVNVHDEFTLMILLTCTFPRHLKPDNIYITDCLGTALCTYIFGSASRSSVMIVLYQEVHNRLLEPTPQTNQVDEEALEIAASLITSSSNKSAELFTLQIGTWICPSDLPYALQDCGLEIMRGLKRAIEGNTISRDAVLDILKGLDFGGTPRLPESAATTLEPLESTALVRCRTGIRDQVVQLIRDWRENNPMYGRNIDDHVEELPYHGPPLPALLHDEVDLGVSTPYVQLALPPTDSNRTKDPMDSTA